MTTAGRPDKIWYLRQTGLFDQLDELDLQRLAALSQMREYPRGRIILGSGSDLDAVHLVTAGRLKVSTFLVEGKEQILALLGRGQRILVILKHEQLQAIAQHGRHNSH